MSNLEDPENEIFKNAILYYLANSQKKKKYKQKRIIRTFIQIILQLIFIGFFYEVRLNNLHTYVQQCL